MGFFFNLKWFVGELLLESILLLLSSYEIVVGFYDVPSGNVNYASKLLVFFSYLRRKVSA
jgi:hypothetical protein